VRSIQALESGTTGRLVAALGLHGEDRSRFEAAGGAGKRQGGGAPGDVASGGPAHNLPLELTSFVGRVAEVAAVRSLLAQTRLLTLVGTGGVGKTRLALRMAAELRPEFADGVWLVELGPLADPALVPQAVAATLGLREDPDRTPRDTLIAAIARRRLLLLLDNCEHLVDACADLAETLLRFCPRLHILATSREALGCAGEMAWRVPSLSLPDMGRSSDPAAVAASDATSLFVERARIAQPAFALTAATAPTVAHLCRRLDGIPLALELAAALLRGLSIDEVAARLDERFRLLTGGRRTALSRQQTLQATVEWSYGLLEERERVLFDRLSVFIGSFDLVAVERVCAGEGVDGPQVLDLLLRLVDKSLVLADVAAHGSTSYRLLETLRQYGRERLAGRAEARAVRERHADYYLSLAEVLVERAKGPEQKTALGDLAATHDDVWAACTWYLESGDLANGLRLQWPLGALWLTRGIGGARALVTRLLAAPGLPEPSRERVQVLHWAGVWCGLIGEPAALTLLEEALVLARQLGDEHLIWQALHGFGFTRFDPFGDLEGALPLLEEALTLCRGRDDCSQIDRPAEFLVHVAQVMATVGDHTRAATLARESLALSRATGDLHVQTYAHEVLGEVAYATGDDATAERLWTECLRTYRDLELFVAIATVAGNLGRLAARRGRPAAAREHFTAALAALHGREPGTLIWGLSELAGLALVAAVEGQPERALRLAGATDAACKGRGFRLWPDDSAALDSAVAQARATLAEPTAAAAWAEGQAMTLEQAVALALVDISVARHEQ
jgi:non-specific serine/threonine protein kinase